MSEINTVSKNVKELKSVLKEKSENDLQLNIDKKSKKSNSLVQPKNFGKAIRSNPYLDEEFSRKIECTPYFTSKYIT